MSRRDIKAENVVREEGGRGLLMDVGLSALEHPVALGLSVGFNRKQLPYPPLTRAILLTANSPDSPSSELSTYPR
jgi:hypothetical protein